MQLFRPAMDGRERATVAALRPLRRIASDARERSRDGRGRVNVFGRIELGITVFHHDDGRGITWALCPLYVDGPTGVWAMPIVPMACALRNVARGKPAMGAYGRVGGSFRTGA